MEVKLYVGNLSFHTTEDQLREMFAQAGTISNLQLMKDRDTGMSRGFAFITMSSQSEAASAIKMFDGVSVDDRNMKVNTATERQERPQGGFGGNSGNRGGRSGGGGGGGRRF